MNRNSKTVLKLVLSVAFIILGAYMTFIHDEAEKKEKEGLSGRTHTAVTEENLEWQDIDYQGKELPMVDNESVNETYNFGKKEIEVYFSNTEELDKGNLPLEAQAVLASEVQTYLRHSGYWDVTELYIYDYQEDAAGITISCNMDGYQDELLIEYLEVEKTLQYSIIKQ